MSKKVKSTFEAKVSTDHAAWRLPAIEQEGEDLLVRLPGYSVLTTMNGYQWSGTSTMTMDELEVLHAFLGDYIRENTP